MSVRSIPVNKEKATVFPDGQMIPHVDDYRGLKDKLILRYVWSWDTLQLLLGTCSMLKKQKIEYAVQIPYMYGERSDRQFFKHQPHYFRDVVAPILNSLKCEIITLDPHSDVVEACIPRIWIVERTKLVENVVKTLGDCCLVVPDAGAIKKSYEIQSMFSDVIYGHKHRDKLTGVLTKIDVNRATVKAGLPYLIVDDICDGGGTFIGLAEAIRKLDPNANIYLYVTHGIFSKGLDILFEHFQGIYTTNSLDEEMKSEGRLIVLNAWIYE